MLGTAAAAVGLALLAAPAAQADPQNANTFEIQLSCANGQHPTVTLLETTPDQAAVHVVGSTAVLVPTTFQWHVQVTDSDGNILDDTTSPPEQVHGRSGERLHTVECTFTQLAHHDWPDVGPVTIEVDGTVQAFPVR
jgi:hypothetical protein